MTITCRNCGVAMKSATAVQRGCCDVPVFKSVEEQLNFWLEHDPEQVCVNCVAVACERRVARA